MRRYPDLIAHRILKQVLHNSQKDKEPISRRSTRVFRVSREGMTSVVPKSLESSYCTLTLVQGRDHVAHREQLECLGGPISLEELYDIAGESSQSELRADDAELTVLRSG
jgi:exoribonuclease R